MAKSTTQKLKIIPLGGLNEIGKNITAIEYGQDIIVVDCGSTFPDEEMLGIDLVIPDVTYLEKNAERVRAFIITHGHEDHIGALPYVLEQVNAPIYGTALTLGIIENRLAEHRMLDKVTLNPVRHGDHVRLGCFSVEFIRTNHSMADSAALAINTPIGSVIFTSDFKIDINPVVGEMTDLTRFGEYGNNGVLLLMQDSTNVERPGFSLGERKVGESFEKIIENCDKRIIIAMFASNVHRIQQVIDIATRYGRKVAVSGRSLETNIAVAKRLGYLDIAEDALVELSMIKKLPPEKTVIIATGSQGEPLSALYRMAFSSHKQVDVKKGDLVVIMASPIPGNENSVNRMINELFRRGAEVIYDKLAEIHASGHACQEELKMILALTKPKYFMPMHGEYRHLQAHSRLAQVMGVPEENVFIGENGKVLEISKRSAKWGGTVPAGKILVDGLSVGDIGSVVLRDRKHLASDGIIAVVVTLDIDARAVAAGPEIITRGFIYVRESEDLMEEMRAAAAKTVEKCMHENAHDINAMKAAIKHDVSAVVYQKTKRSPMILPIITEV
ncbi:MAG: ribonuclease J [Oscillospiraceae bacterium]|nr:ribonuclease J [Oscillospiraceae bacterium]MBQ3879824.1 ribonuclease J [Oscillospiraceae bacterium]